MKIRYLIALLCSIYMHTTYTMQTASLEDELGDLQRDLTALKNTLQPPSTKSPLCKGGICKGKQGKRGGRPYHRQWKKRHHGPQTPEQREHAKARHQFKELQRQAGIQPKHHGRRKGAAPWRGAKRPQRSQADRTQLKKIRSTLNTLLEKENLSETEQQEFNQKVNELEKLKPHRWPRAEDYKALYTKKYQP